MHVTSDVHVWTCVELVVGERPTVEVCKAVNNVQRDAITARGSDGLRSTELDALLIDGVTECLPLNAGVDGLASTHDSILMTNKENVTTLGLDDATDSAKGNLVKGVVINTLDVDVLPSQGNDTNIVNTCQATICTTIHESTSCP